MVILIIAIFVGIALMLLPRLYRERKIKELITTGALWVLGFVLTVLYIENVTIPSPITALKGLLDMINLHY